MPRIEQPPHVIILHIFSSGCDRLVDIGLPEGSELMMHYATGKIWKNVIEVRTPIPSWLPCSILFLRHQVAAVVRRVLVAGGHLREPTPTGDHCLKQSQIGKWCDPGRPEVRRNSLQGSSNCACLHSPDGA